MIVQDGLRAKFGERYNDDRASYTGRIRLKRHKAQLKPMLTRVCKNNSAMPTHYCSGAAYPQLCSAQLATLRLLGHRLFGPAEMTHSSSGMNFAKSTLENKLF